VFSLLWPSRLLSPAVLCKVRELYWVDQRWEAGFKLRTNSDRGVCSLGHWLPKRSQSGFSAVIDKQGLPESRAVVNSSPHATSLPLSECDHVKLSEVAELVAEGCLRRLWPFPTDFTLTGPQWSCFRPGGVPEMVLGAT